MAHSVTTGNQKSLGHVSCTSTRGTLDLEGFPPPLFYGGILFFNQTSNNLGDTLEVKVPWARNQLRFLLC